MGNIIIQSCNGVTIRQEDDRLWINGEEIEMPKSIFFKNCLIQRNGKNYINGKEWIASQGKWRYTLKSL